MTQEEKRLADVTIIVLGMFDKMRDAGIVNGGRFRLSEDGRKRYQALIAADFTPTKNEIDMVVEQLQTISELQEDPEAKAEIEMLEDYRDSHPTK